MYGLGIKGCMGLRVRDWGLVGSALGPPTH